MQFKKIAIAVLLSSAILALTQPQVYAFDTHDSLNVPAIRQTYSNTSCWAACGASISTHLNVPTSESGFAAKVGIPLTQLANIGEVITGFNRNGIYPSQYIARMDFVAYKDQIYYKRRPVFIQFYGHAVVGEGYRTYTGKNEVLVMDPEFGSSRYYDYSNLGENTTINRWWLGGLTF